ncbi:unnamed protein product [Moneuplotes crassus]|uniref:Trafficking protein particle complex subunit 11 domain-containing protein n=3 Tax=Euplotes crassus TaxID=5936 RepID=A0AAD2CXM2_EUPCR|nr:unnamed protein product [Moneuplotes crassus]
MENYNPLAELDILETTSVKEICKTGARPLVHLYGSPYLHRQIISCINDEHGIKNKMPVRYKSHNFDDLIDIQQYDEETRADGMYRKSWFKKIYDDLPSVIIMIYDWSQDESGIGWSYREDEIRSKISQLKERSRDAKIMLLVFLSEKEDFSLPGNRIENKITSLRKNTELEPKGIFLVTTGVQGFANLSKKFESTMQDYSLHFYKDLKYHTKLKQKRIAKDDPLNVRYNFKNGYYTEIIKDSNKAVKFYQGAYQLIKEIKESKYSKYSGTELREVADLIVLKLFYCYFRFYNIEPALALFKSHFDLFSRKIHKMKDKIKFLEINWRYETMKEYGVMLQKAKTNKTDRFKDFWYYPGYYFLNCLHLIQQKMKLFQLHNYTTENPESEQDEIPEAKNDPMHPAFTKLNLLWFDPHEFQSQYLVKENDFIGKNPLIFKEPDAMSALGGQDFKDALIMYKVYNELSFDYGTEFESLLTKTLDCYTSQANAERMVDYIHSMASDFYFKQEDYRKCREMKSFVAKRLARQNWNNVAVDLIENVKVCSLKMDDHRNFIHNEFELINVKKEDIEIKKQRLQRILTKFDESNLQSQIFTMNNPLISVYARFDVKRAEIFDSVTLSIRIDSSIDLTFNKLYVNFNEKGFNKEIFDSDGGELKLQSSVQYSNDLTIFVKSQIQGDLKLDYVVLEKKNGDNTLSLLIHPSPDVNFDSLIFGDKNGDEINQKVSDDPNEGLRLKISETRQKVELALDYRERIFLGELVPIDMTFKSSQGCEIVDSYLSIVDISNDTSSTGDQQRTRSKSQIKFRKSTSIPIKCDDGATSDFPFDIANSPEKQPKDDFVPHVYYCEASGDSFEEFPKDEDLMRVLKEDSTIRIPDFSEKQQMRCRICPKFYEEGPKGFRLTLKYKIVKVYEDVRSDPIPMSITRIIKLSCEPPFKVELNYEVKDWLTNGLNVRESEANQSHLDSFIKVPVGEEVPLSIDVTSISAKPISIKNVELDILSTGMISKVSKNKFEPVETLDEGDTISAGFVLNATKVSNDTGQYGDVLIEWSRLSEFKGNVLRNICRVPTLPLSIVSSPLCVKISTPETCFNICEVFTLEVEMKNTTEISMNVCYELINSRQVIVSGERKSYINLMPLDCEVFRYTCIPLKKGLISLPAVRVGKDEGYHFISKAARNIHVT